MRADWQHVTIAALAIVGGVACALRPEVAHYIGPLLTVLVSAALAKGSPLDPPPPNEGP